MNRMKLTIRWLFLGALCLLLLLPVLWLMITAVKPSAEIYNASLPTRIDLTAFQTVIREYRFDYYFRNSLIVAVTTTLLVTVLSVLAAYGFAKFRYPGSRLIFTACVLLRMVPFISLMIPLYIMVSKVNLMNTRTALILADTTFSLPMALWIMEGFLRSFPNELMEAGEIDGASKMRTLVQIVIPVSTPAISTVVILTFIGVWNEFMFAFITTSTDAAKTLTVGIAMLTQNYGIRWDLMTSAGVLYLVPTLILAIGFQRYIVSGLTVGAIKG